MANEFIITLSNGSVLTTIPEGTVDTTSTSLALHGRGKANYGQQRDQNLVHMLENFAGSPAPVNPLIGQIWFDPVGNDFLVWNGSPANWSTFGAGAGASTTPPPGTASIGELWYDLDPSNDLWSRPQLKIYQGPAGIGSPVIGGSPEWISIAENYLPLHGGTMSGTLVLGGNNITGVGLIIASGAVTADSFGAVSTISTGFGSITSATGFLGADGAVSGVTYGFTDDTTNNTGMYRIAENRLGFATGGTLRLEIESNGTLNVAGTTNYENLVTSDDDVPNKKYVDDTYVNITGDTMTGALTVNANLSVGVAGSQFLGVDGSISQPTYSFTADEDVGMYRSGTNQLSFTTTSIRRLTIESNGTLNVAGTLNYETLVTSDDDIPNKKYVDDIVGTNPTSNTFQGTNTITGLTTGKQYLVSIYGFDRNAGEGNATHAGIKIRNGSTVNSGTLLESTPSQLINWTDGNPPDSYTFVVTTSSSSINGQIDNSFNGSSPPTAVVTRMDAVQLD